MMKYHNKKCKLNGKTFDSTAEAERYYQLQQLQKAGKISCLERQVKYDLIPPMKLKRPRRKCVGGSAQYTERRVSYTADFVYLNDKGEKVVEDVKGMRTDDYIIKRKLMLWVHGIQIDEVVMK